MADERFRERVPERIFGGELAVDAQGNWYPARGGYLSFDAWSRVLHIQITEEALILYSASSKRVVPKTLPGWEERRDYALAHVPAEVGRRAGGPPPFSLGLSEGPPSFLLTRAFATLLVVACWVTLAFWAWSRWG